MLGFLGRRVVTLLFTLLAASVVVFTVLEVLPGDPALLMLGTEAREDTLAALRSQMGLDRPAPVRYLDWAGGALTGDFGTSYTYKMPVATLVGDRLAVTAPLALLALLLSTALAIPLGMLAAVKHNRIGDWGVMGFSQLGLAVPSFWVGIMLIWAFALQLRWFGAGGFPGWSAGWGTALQALVLPAVALALTEAAILARIVRSAMLETMREDYVRTARAKGLSKGQVLRRHVLRNAAIPVTTIVGITITSLIALSAVVERAFSLDGLGAALVQAALSKDFAVVQGIALVLVAAFVVANAIVDLLYAVLDPRIRYVK